MSEQPSPTDLWHSTVEGLDSTYPMFGSLPSPEAVAPINTNSESTNSKVRAGLCKGFEQRVEKHSTAPTKETQAEELLESSRFGAITSLSPSNEHLHSAVAMKPSSGTFQRVDEGHESEGSALAAETPGTRH